MKEIKNLKQAQIIMLNELIEVDRICKKYNIPYWLDSGTLLGAVRHKGFIPWDDDIDICILKEDYNRLLNIIEKEIDSKYFVQSKKSDKYYFSSWIKIRDRNSIMICSGNEKFHQGIAIDIFPMSCYSNINKQVYKILIKLKEISYDTYEKFSIKRTLKKILIRIKVNKICEKFLKYKEKGKIKNIGYTYKWEQLYRYEDILPLSEIEFEGYKFSCPNNIDSVLKELYGENYMELPPEKDRIWHTKEIILNKKCFFEKELEKIKNVKL